jgi:hypothetical protein
MNSSATIIGRRRVSDCWIPCNFSEIPTAARSAEAAREISHREIRVLKFMRTGKLKVLISRHNWDHPFGRMCGSDRAPPGEA